MTDSVRLIIAFLVSSVGGLVAISLFLPILKGLKAEQSILEYVTEHKEKQGTPTMGGVAFLIVILVSSAFLFIQGASLATLTVIITIAYGIVGLLDDIIKVKFKRNLGLKAYQKVIVQLAIAIIVGFWVYRNPFIGSNVILPFVMTEVNFSWLIIPFVIFIFLACTNGVNLTDGLDGLASNTTICYLFFTVILLKIQLDKLSIQGDVLQYREIYNLMLLCVVVIGALLAFGVFNCNPAKVFMGDVGSMALGAVVACVSIFSRMSLFIPVLGLMYVVACVSVLLQVGYFKVTSGKRIFLMAPYHHHLQTKGMSETRIVNIYSFITILLGGIVVLFALL